MTALLALCLWACGHAAGQATDWKQISRPPLPPFHPQQPVRVVLPNGMVIFLQEDHELPLIEGQATVRGGSREEPAAKVGLVSIYGEVWRTGGTKSKTGDQLDDFLEARGARVESGDGVDSTNLSFSCLKGDFDDVFAIFTELLQQPEFREDKITLAKTQENTAIARRNDNVQGIAGREASKLGYGAENPYARHTEYATVAAVTRDDLLNWHKQYVHPNNIILGIVGDFDAKAMEARLRKAFAAWPKGPQARPAAIEYQPAKPGVYFVAKDDVNQSEIRMVHLGIRRDNPDYFAVEVMNEVFGTSALARLFTSIRSRKGLAYAVGGGVRSAFDHPGLFSITMSTKSNTTVEAIHALYEEIDNFLGPRPATEEELKRAKDGILNSFVFNFDSKGKVLRERMRLEFYGYPADFLERYQAAIEKVTVDDVNRVARKYIQKDKLAVLVVGKAADFDKPLASLGTVTALDVTIPEAGPKTPAVAGSNAEGKALAAKVVQALGGAEKLRAIKAIRRKGTSINKTPQGEMAFREEGIVVYPDRSWTKVTLPMGEMTIVISPEASFMAMGGMPPREVPGPMKQEGVSDIKRDLVFIAQNVENPKFVFAAAGTEKIGETEAAVLEINADGTPLRWYVDPQSGRVLRAAYRASSMTGPVDRVEDYSDWREVDGLRVPFKSKSTDNGAEVGSSEKLELEVNPVIDPKLFEKPAEAAAQQPSN
ncbi:MAG TPA: pitrilysin family protein [Terriglobales bacterium]|nr:pitrilysin family protein [Terriglobales bacterium]